MLGTLLADLPYLGLGDNEKNNIKIESGIHIDSILKQIVQKPNKPDVMASKLEQKNKWISASF